jgi:glycerophosphoryl diester phosphodiesterase
MDFMPASSSVNLPSRFPETKHPTYFQGISLPLEEPLAAALERNGLNSKNAAVFVQSFEVANLQKLQKLTHARLIQLFGAKTARPYDFVVSGDPRGSTS